MPAPRLALALLLAGTACAAPEEPAGSTPQAARRPTAPPADSTGAPLDSAAVWQVVYVPVYSHIYYGDHRLPIDLTVTLSVRNTDARRPIRLSSVRYYDTAGSLVETYVEQPVRLGPLATAEYVVVGTDARGGSGASFLVEWAAGEPVREPVVEAVMISTAGTQGLSFVSAGRVVESAGRLSAPSRRDP